MSYAPSVVYVVKPGIALAGGRTGFEVVRCQREYGRTEVVTERHGTYTREVDAETAAMVANGRMATAENEVLQ